MSQSSRSSVRSNSDPETARLLTDYSRSIQRDIKSRGPYGSVSFENGSPSFLASSSQSNDQPHDTEGQTENQVPFYLKSIALTCALLLAFGSHYESHALGILKSELKHNLDITNAQYGILQSSVALVNTVLPIVGGLFVDNFGVELGSLIATTCITLGAFLVAMASNNVSFPLMVLGRAIYGLGSGSIVIVQGAIISQWFTSSGLSLAMGLKITTSRLASFLAMSTVFPIMSWTGFYGSAFWVAAGLCLLSLLANLGYVLAVRKVNSQQSSNENLKEKKDFHPKKILEFQPGFWILALLAVSLGAGWNTFLHFVTELLQIRFDKSPNEAGYLTSATQLVPLVIPPIAGYLQDKLGGRLYLILLSAIGFTISMAILGFSFLPPLIGILLFSFSLATGPAAIMPGITLIVPSAGVATALGLYKSSLNVAAAFQDILVGKLQPDHPSPDSYSTVMFFMIVVGIISTLIAVFLVVADRYNVIDINHASDEPASDLESSSFLEFNHKTFNQAAISIYVIALIGSWGLFISGLI